MFDPDDLAHLYDRHSRELLAFIYSLVKSRETAEDLLHDSFINLMRYSGRRDLDDTNIRALLYTIARNLCIDHIRRERRRGFGIYTLRHEPGGPDTTPDQVEMDEAGREISRILESADALTRSVFLMRRESKLTYPEIARSLNISERTAKRKMRKMLNILSDELKKSGILAIFLFTLACIVRHFVVF